VTRTLALDLIALAEERKVEGRNLFGVVIGKAFFPIAAADDLEDLA
jgi:hypothetical protein